MSQEKALYFRQTPAVFCFQYVFSSVHYKNFFLLGEKKKKKKTDSWADTTLEYSWLIYTPSPCTECSWQHLKPREECQNPGQAAGSSVKVFSLSAGFLQKPADHFRLPQATLHHCLTTLWQWVTKVRMMGRGCKRSSYIILAFVTFISLSIPQSS